MRFSRNFNSATAVLAVALLAGACSDANDAGDLPTDATPDIEAVAGSGGIDLGAALSIHSRATPDLMSIEGVVGTGLGLAADGQSPRIRVYTLNGSVPGIPAHVDGIPVERVVTGRIDIGGVGFMSLPTSEADINNPATRERPAPNGFSLGHPDITAGTLSAIVRDNADVCYALSNNHVLANTNAASIGDNALQPGDFDGGQNPADAIGTLADFEPYDFEGSNVIDAAIAELFDAALVTGATPSYAYGAPSATTVNASLGMNVQKFGRTTEHTFGEVAEVNLTVNICTQPRGPFLCSQTVRFVDQIAITDGSFSDGGDSGSLIVTANGSKNPVGLLFAGSSTRTIANRIQPVLSRFNVVIETNLANCTNGGTGPGNISPEADFTFATNGLDVDFTDRSGDSDGSVVSWSWDFDDGNSSSAQNPSHTYAAGGSYDVTLTVMDDGGATNSTTQQVTVDDGNPGGGFTLSANGSKDRGRHVIDLSWSGAAGANVDVYRNGSLIATTANDGSYSDATGQRGGATYTHQVCEAGTSTCSNTTTTIY